MTREALDVLVAHIPATHTEQVLAALFDAGAGAVGEYRECAFVQRGEGRFRPVGGANPTIGEVGRPERVVEDRVEVTFPRSRRALVVKALRAAHPYEEPSFHVLTNVGDETPSVPPAP
ncbi:hypothetical protein NMQ01_04385 [Janibacter sp. CX7]|uniref:hypothetical protein n=1 Tax=Janibacter sp. CX7 TaxID=2963431 RepID=UPI0020CC6C65|nr:hypothetical protein [Janibacter sp. CX7]UTT66960.1 hypothetical protein NMQ01_04385 [Janibacter sp. CX7]